MIEPTEIVAARGRRGWSQTRLAHEVGVSLKAIQQWESGAVTPHRGNEARLAAVLLDTAPSEADPFAGRSDLELIAELTRRAARRETHSAQTGEITRLPTVYGVKDGVASRLEAPSGGGGADFDDEVVGSLEPRSSGSTVQPVSGDSPRRHHRGAS
jgi:transcriptional regulator with XRE-family HTH domain